MLQFEEREFKVLARCDKASFVRLVEMIEDHPVFDKGSRKSPVWLQLLIVLNRLGCCDPVVRTQYVLLGQPLSTLLIISVTHITY